MEDRQDRGQHHDAEGSQKYGAKEKFASGRQRNPDGNGRKATRSLECTRCGEKRTSVERVSIENGTAGIVTAGSDGQLLQQLFGRENLHGGPRTMRWTTGRQAFRGD